MNVDLFDCCKVERGWVDDAELVHGLYFEGNLPDAVVQIRLFGRVYFRVHFLGLVVAGPQYAYTHKLVPNKHYIQHFDEGEFPS
jgi:hypothetical protein